MCSVCMQAWELMQVYTQFHVIDILSIHMTLPFRPSLPAPPPPLLPQPPPPGVAPTAAQMASQQGQNVVMSQQKRDVWGGGSDGGYTLF